MASSPALFSLLSSNPLPLTPLPGLGKQHVFKRPVPGQLPLLRGYVPPSEEQMAKLSKAAVTRADKAHAMWVLKHGHRQRVQQKTTVKEQKEVQVAAKEAAPALSAVGNLVSGTFAGFVICLVGHPFDTIKVRLQTTTKYTGAFDCIRQTVAKEGVRGLYKGMGSPLSTVPVLNALVFWAYGASFNYLSSKQEDPDKFQYSTVAMAGAYAGLLNSFIVGPVELVKTKLQLQFEGGANQFKGPVDGTIQLVKKYGIGVLAKGMYATILREVPGYAAQFGFYELCRRLLASEENVDSLGPAALMTAGGIGGFMAWVFSYPQDVVKSKIQAEEAFPTKYKKTFFDGGFWNAMVKTFKSEGMKGIWRGFGTCAARAFPSNAAGFFAFETAAAVIRKWELQRETSRREIALAVEQEQTLKRLRRSKEERHMILKQKQRAQEMESKRKPGQQEDDEDEGILPTLSAETVYPAVALLPPLPLTPIVPHVVIAAGKVTPPTPDSVS